MALSKIQAESMNLADTFAFTGTVSGAGNWTETASIGTLDSATETVTGIPSGTRELFMTFHNVTTSSATPNPYLVRLGTSTGVVTSGYSGMGIYSYDPSNVVTPFVLSTGIADIGNWGAGTKWTGIFHCWNSHSNTWIANSSIEDTTGSYDARIDYLTKVDLGGTLDRISISASAGTINAGTIKVWYR